MSVRVARLSRIQQEARSLRPTSCPWVRSRTERGRSWRRERKGSYDGGISSASSELLVDSVGFVLRRGRNKGLHVPCCHNPGQPTTSTTTTTTAEIATAVEGKEDSSGRASKAASGEAQELSAGEIQRRKKISEAMK